MILKGSGGLAEQILSAKNSIDAGGSLEQIIDPDTREIVETGNLRAIQIEGDTDSVTRLLLEPIQSSGEVLEDAWSRFDDLDLSAVDKQRLFRSAQVAVLLLTVLATVLAVVISLVKLHDDGRHPTIHSAQVALHVTMIIVPIAISLLVGFNARFREGNKWILLRAAAEGVKQHIFRFRTRSGVYSEDQCTSISAQVRLAANIRDITSNLVQSEVNRMNLPQRKVVDENRSKFLTPDDYISERLENQIDYFVNKTQNLYQQLRRLQFWILFAGGLSTFLAAIKLEVWVALTTAFATAFASKLEVDQVENSLVQYNTALMSLRNIESWWKGLSPWERSRRKNIDLLVDQTETTLEHETAGWVQRMQSTLEKLTEKESSAGQDNESTKKG
jgi:hypothetical protein